MTMPNYSEMNGQQLLDAYNAIAVAPRRSKFQSRADGVAACERAWAARTVPVLESSPTPVGVEEVPAKWRKRIKLKQERNPYRDKSHSRRHFEAMRGNPTISEYLIRFAPEARRTAQQWLSNMVRSGYVEVVE